MTYDIYLVPNGRLRDFDRGYLGTGYPDHCECWGNDMTLEEVREHYRELAERIRKIRKPRKTRKAA